MSHQTNLPGHHDADIAAAEVDILVVSDVSTSRPLYDIQISTDKVTCSIPPSQPAARPKNSSASKRSIGTLSSC